MKGEEPKLTKLAPRWSLEEVRIAAHHVLSKNFYASMDVPVAGVAHQSGTCALRLGDRTPSQRPDIPTLTAKGHRR